jgi:hypothetical protein
MELTDYIKYCLGYINLPRRKALSEQQKNSAIIPKEHFSLLGLLNGDLDGNVAEPILLNTFYALDPKNIPQEQKVQYEKEKQLANKIEDIYNAYRNDQFTKQVMVGSGDQRNTLWGTVELEGDRHGTHGASGLVCGPERGPVASVETGAVVERDRSGTRQARRINSWRAVLERGVHSSRSQAVALGTDAGGARRNFAWHGDGFFNPADCCHARSSAVDRQP